MGDGNQHSLFAINQCGSVVAGDFEAVAVGDGVGGTGFDAKAAEDAAVVIDVINLSVALAAADAELLGIFRRFDINAIGGAGGRAQETGDAFL